MLTVPTEVIHKAIAILGVEGVSENEVESDIASFAGDKMVARRLIDWVPEAFGIVLASHIGKINLPATFSHRIAHILRYPPAPREHEQERR